MQMYYIPCPNMATAEKISLILLEYKLIACANILNSISSIYIFEGKIEKSSESILLIKTDLSQQKKKLLFKKLRENHPYKIPCLLELNTKKINKDYSNWIKASLK